MSDPIVTPAIRERVTEAFGGFEGNADAIHAVKRALMVALASSPVALDKTFLLSGPPSTGKSEIARRVARCMDLPCVQLDGKAIRSRERLFAMIDDALAARDRFPRRDGNRGGVPLLHYPPFVVSIDEIHLVPDGVQQGFLTALERDDRSVFLDAAHERRIAMVRGSAFIFATTKPADLDRALRTRCTEITLQRYTAAEVASMVTRRYSQFPREIAERIAVAGRLTPRVAFEIASDLREELWISDDPSVSAALRRVLKGRGILIGSVVTDDNTPLEIGLSANDVRALRAMVRERRPVGEGVLLAELGDVDGAVVRDDVEPHLIRMGLMRVTEKGREITGRGRLLIERLPREGNTTARTDEEQA